MPDQELLFYRFFVALLIGTLIGLQREHSYDLQQDAENSNPAGIRSFALMGLAGCSMAMVAAQLASPAVFLGLFLALSALIIMGYHHSARLGDLGMTSELAAILVVVAGALCYWGELKLAVAIGVAVAALLSLKMELHRLAECITREEIFASLKFALISLIILPLLPKTPLGPAPFDVVNLYSVWLMVVLISGISFLGYILMRWIGAEHGIGLTGLLGGLASSTATTLSFTQRSHTNTGLAHPFSLAILLAWLVMMGRVVLEVAVIAPALLQLLWLPMLFLTLVILLICWQLQRVNKGESGGSLSLSNPFEFLPAISFGLIYGVILILLRAAQEYFGNAGLYLSSVLSGLADVDAITLSVAQMVRQGTVDMDSAARSIMMAIAANSLVKGGMVLMGGAVLLRQTFLPRFLIVLVAGIVAVFLV